MSDQQDQRQDNQLERRQHRRPVVLPPRVLAIIRITDILIHLVYLAVLERFAARAPPIPYHTSALSGAGWVDELLNGHPRRIQTELGVCRSTFTLLVKAMQKAHIHSSRNVSIEEQVAIFLYTAVTGLTCAHVGERFQRSSSTITKCVSLTPILLSLTDLGILNGSCKRFRHPPSTPHACYSPSPIRPLLQRSKSQAGFTLSSRVLWVL